MQPIVYHHHAQMFAASSHQIKSTDIAMGIFNRLVSRLKFLPNQLLNLHGYVASIAVYQAIATVFLLILCRIS